MNQEAQEGEWVEGEVEEEGVKGSGVEGEVRRRG